MNIGLPATLFELSRTIDRNEAAAAFEADGRVQIRDFLTAPAARPIHHVLHHETPCGLA